MDRGRAGSALTRVAVPAVAMAVAVLLLVRHRRRVRVADRYEDRQTERTIVVDRDRMRVYWLCREPERVAATLDPGVRAVRVDDRWSQWLVPAADGVDQLLSVEVVGDIPEMLIAWRVRDDWLPIEGTIRLAEAGPERTEVTVNLRYRWAGGDDPVNRWLERALDRVAAAATVQPSGA